MIQRMKIGSGALILEPWAISRPEPPPKDDAWSPFEGARNVERGPLSRWKLRAMRRRNKSLNGEALNQLGIVPTDHVLEIGYGPGDALAMAAKMATKGFVAGIDRSLQMLAVGYKRTRKSRARNLVVLRGDVSWTPWSPCSFDKAFCVDGITEWPCTRSGLEEVFRVLKPRGVFVIAEHVSKRFTKRRALALAHLLHVVGFQNLEVKLQVDRGGESLLITAVRI